MSGIKQVYNQGYKPNKINKLNALNLIIYYTPAEGSTATTVTTIYKALKTLIYSDPPDARTELAPIERYSNSNKFLRAVRTTIKQSNKLSHYE